MKRLETGVVQCGDDWPGIFIRGDHALYYAFQLSILIEKLDENQDIHDVILRITLSDLQKLLDSCNATAKPDIQNIKMSDKQHVELEKNDDSE